MASASFCEEHRKEQVDAIKVRLREVGGLGRGLWNSRLHIEAFAERYAQWYTSVERTIVEMITVLGFEVDARPPGTKHHRFHEAVLELLRDPTNPLYEFLGESEVHELLRSAKTFRNIWTGNKRFSNTFNPLTCRETIGNTMFVEFGLWAALGVFSALLEVDETKTKREQVLEHLSEREQELEIQRQDLRREMEQIVLDKESLRQAEEDFLRLQGGKEKESAECEARAKVVCAEHEELLKRITEAHKLLSTKTALRKEVEKLKATVKELKDSRAADIKMGIQEAVDKEMAHIQGVKDSIETEVTQLNEAHQLEINQLNEAHQLEINQLREAHQREIEQLKEAHGREQEARQKTYYAECKAMIIGHQCSLGSESPTKPMGEDTNGDTVDLASLLRKLIAEHVRDGNIAKSLREEVGRLRDQVADYEAYKQTDFGVVQALIEKMDGCTEPGHQTLKRLFEKREYSTL